VATRFGIRPRFGSRFPPLHPHRPPRCTARLTDDQARDRFSPLQLDVFHALYEDYHGDDMPDSAKRPAGEPSRGERERVSAEEALRLYPKGTLVGREFADAEGNTKVFRGKVYGFSDPYWRVRYSDGDWEELNRREMRQGVAEAVRLPPPPQQDA